MIAHSIMVKTHGREGWITSWSVVKFIPFKGRPLALTSLPLKCFPHIPTMSSWEKHFNRKHQGSTHLSSPVCFAMGGKGCVVLFQFLEHWTHFSANLCVYQGTHSLLYTFSVNYVKKISWYFLKDAFIDRK